MKTPKTSQSDKSVHTKMFQMEGHKVPICIDRQSNAVKQKIKEMDKRYKTDFPKPTEEIIISLECNYAPCYL